MAFADTITVADQSNSTKKVSLRESSGDEALAAPIFIRGPESREIMLGAKFVLRVTATGTPQPNYQWYLNGKKICGANTDRLMIHKAMRSHCGTYTCEARNLAGKAMSSAAKIEFLVEQIPDIVIEPSVASIPIGQPFKFRIATPSLDVLKRLKLQWTFNGKRISGATGPELQFTQVKSKYEGEYKVVILAGGDIHASNCVKLLPLSSEEAPHVQPALTREKTALIAAPPKDTFFYNPLSDEDHGISEPEEFKLEEETAPEADPISPPPLPPADLGRKRSLKRKKAMLEQLLHRWQSSSADKKAA